MLTRAIKRGWLPGQRWPVDATPEDFRKVEGERELTIKERAAFAVCMALGAPDPRIRQISVRNAIAMEGQNLDAEKADREQDNPPMSPVQVNVGVSVRQGLIDDPEYLEYLRSRASESNGHASTVCQNGQPGPVENGSAPGAPGSGTNGFGSGPH